MYLTNEGCLFMNVLNLKIGGKEIKYLFSIATLLVFIIPYSNQGLSNPVIFAYGMIFVAIYFMLLPKTGDIVKLIANNKILFSFVGYAAFSGLWSDHTLLDPTLRLAKFLVVTLFCVFLLVNYNTKDCMKIVVTSLSILAVLNLFTCLFIPSLGIHDVFSYHAGEWRGISSHKNTMGTLSLLCFIGNMAMLYKDNNSNKLSHGALMAVSVLLIYKSGSATAFIITVALTLVILSMNAFLKIRSRALRGFIFTYSVLLVMTFAFLTFSNFSALATGVGKDPNLTGRTGLWVSADRAIRDELYLGHGFGSFFSDKNLVLSYFDLEITSSHSGFRDLLLDLGIVGMVLIVSILLITLVKLLKNQGKYEIYIWMQLLGFSIFTIINNITDSRFLNSLAIYWIIFFITSSAVQKNTHKS